MYIIVIQISSFLLKILGRIQKLKHSILYLAPTYFHLENQG